jgi:type II secretory pathway component PulF
MIEPLCIILFGGIVIFVAMALLQAVYGLRPA